MNWVIIGTGRVGRALFHLAEEVGADVVATWSRSQPYPESRNHFVNELEQLADHVDGNVVFLSVVDDAISNVASQIPNLDKATAVFHLSGSQSSELLSPFSERRGSIHPVLSISDPRTAAAGFRNAFWSLEGDRRAVAIGRDILSRIDVEPAEISGEDKVLYHCSAVMAAGHFVTLFAAAERVAKEAGLNEEDARRMLATLSQSCLDNIRSKSPAEAFTGPIARGDKRTASRHRDALREGELSGELSIYDVLASYNWKD